MKDLIKNNSTEIIENILRTLLAESYVDIRFNDLKKDYFATITFNDYIEDKEYSIRFYKNNSYHLVVGYYDDEDEFFEIEQPLTNAEIDSIPDGLKKVMKKVLIDEDGLRVPSQLLVGKK